MSGMGSIPSNKVKFYQVTDVTDIALSVVPIQANVGAAFNMNIPTKGLIKWTAMCSMLSATASVSVVFGLRVAGVNYWPQSAEQGTTRYAGSLNDATGSFGTDTLGGIGPVGSSSGTSGGSSNTANGSQECGIPIEASGIPTGTQSVQLIAGMMTTTGTATLKGTLVTTNVYIEVVDVNP